MPNLEILWTGPALGDLRSIREHLSNEGRPMAARKLARRFLEAVERLARFPDSGRPVPEAFGYREVIVAPYRIVYTSTRDRIVILRVWHGRRDLESLEKS